MKNIGIWNYYESLNYNNYFLLNKDAGIGDNLLEPFNRLYLEGKEQNINFMTFDMIDDFDKMDGFIFFDFPNMNNKYVKKVFLTKKSKYLIIFESELIRPDNWDIENHKYFRKILTWADDIIDNMKYFKCNLSQEIPKIINKDLLKKKKLCTLIAGNKKNPHSLELYSKRVEAIKWFEKYHLNDFDFYGIGWNKYYIANKYINMVYIKMKLFKVFKPNFPSYKGSVNSKKEILEQYKFAICYENARDIPGYITEKIFDCFFAGCIPIYWGANNITEHISKECFIDKREFATYEDLYQFIKNMSNDEYMKYMHAIEKYLQSEKICEYSSEFFSKAIINTILLQK